MSEFEYKYYTYDAEKKRFIAPNGEELRVRQALDHMNNMYHALYALHGIWGGLHDVVEAMDSIFLGAAQGEDIPEDAEVEDEEDKDKDKDKDIDRG